MPILDSQKVGWYRILLKLYPKAYRKEYEAEMLTTLQEMYLEAESPKEKRQFLVRTIKDYFLSLTQQSLWATEQSFNDIPYAIKREFIISASLVAPFSIIFIYNIVSLVMRHGVLLSHLEARTWVIYSIILPLFAIVLSAKTCISGIYGQLVKCQWSKASRTIIHNWLFLGGGIITIAMVAIF